MSSLTVYPKQQLRAAVTFPPQLWTVLYSLDMRRSPEVEAGDSSSPRPARMASFSVPCAKGKDVDWTFLSPSAGFVPGKRTEKFCLGGNELLVDSTG